MSETYTDIEELQRSGAEAMGEARAIESEYKGRQLEMPRETAERLAEVLTKVEDINTRLALARRFADLSQPAAPPAGFAGSRPAGENEGLESYDAKSWREIETKGLYGEVYKARFHVPLSVQKKGYRGAFEGYLHKGMSGLTGFDQKSLSEGTDTSGGFLVPEDVQTRIIQKMMTMAVIRPNASVLPVGRDVVSFPFANYTTASDDSSGILYSSPARPTATGEVPSSATVHQITSTTWGKKTIPVNTVMMSEIVYNDFLEDAVVDIGQYLADKFAEGYALYEEDQFINGTGVNAPLGILNYIGTANQGPVPVISDEESAPYCKDTGILNVEATLPSQYEANAKWLARKSMYNYIRQIKTATTETPLWPIAAQQGYLGTVPPSLLGYPILKSEFMPAAANNAYPLLLGDLRAYQIVDRVGLSIQRLDELLADQNARKFLARKRFGGQLLEPWKIIVMEVEETAL